MWITVDPFTYQPRVYKSKEVAMRESIKLNKADKNGPSFLFFCGGSQNSQLVGRLIRKFGTEDFYIGQDLSGKEPGS